MEVQHDVTEIKHVTIAAKSTPAGYLDPEGEVFIPVLAPGVYGLINVFIFQ